MSYPMPANAPQLMHEHAKNTEREFAMVKLQRHDDSAASAGLSECPSRSAGTCGRG